MIENQYYIIGKIGGGSFGCIYKAINYKTKQNFAIKIEEEDVNNCLFYLKQEVKILRELNEFTGFPKLYTSGKIDDKFYMVMSLLGSNLETIKMKCGGFFEIKTVCYLAISFINRIEALHSKNFIHRDIKPQNFVTGFNKDFSNIFLIDFGLAKLFSNNFFFSLIIMSNFKS